MKKHVVSVLGIALALATALPFAQGASASLTASAGTYRADERAKEAGRDLDDAASIANGDIYAAVLAQDASLYKNAEDSKTAVQLKKGDALLLYYDGLHTNGKTTDRIGVLYNNVPCYVSESAFLPEGNHHPLYERLFTEDILFYARARESIPVYSKPSAKGKRLGRIPASGNFAVLESKKGSYEIVYGDGVGYISSKSPVSKMQQSDWETSLLKATLGQVTLGTWDYNGLLAEKRDATALGKVHKLYLSLINGEEISEVYYKNAAMANVSAQTLMEKNELLICADYGEELYEAFPVGEDIRFYSGSNAIICYEGNDQAVLAALEDAHGESFYRIR